MLHGCHPDHQVVYDVPGELTELLGRELRDLDPEDHRARKYTLWVNSSRCGKAEVVLSQLTLKFRKVSAATKKRVQSASLEELDRYAARILSAKTLDEVFKKR